MLCRTLGCGTGNALVSSIFFYSVYACRPGLLGLVGSLDWHHPLGVTRARAKGHVQCYGDFLSAKRQHPKAVVLVRVSSSAWTCHGHQGSPRPLSLGRTAI